MGCCETREDTSTKLHPRKSQLRNMTKYADLNMLQDQDLIVVSQNQLKKVKIEHDAIAVRYYIEWCRLKHKWKELSIFIWDSTQIKEKSVINNFSEHPKTLSSLVLIYFLQGLKEEGKEIVKVSDEMLPDLLKLIPLSDKDFGYNFLLLTEALIEYQKERTIKLLISFSFFESIRKYICHKDRRLNKLTLKICRKMCFERKYAQDQFITSECAIKVIRQLVSSKLNIETDLEDLADSLYCLINLPENKINDYSVKKLINYSLLEILYTLKTLVPEELPASMSLLLQVLSPHE